MSYNIDSVTEITVGRPLSFSLDRWRDIGRPDEDLPQSNPFENGGRFTWSGPWSGQAYENGTLRDVVACSTGDATYLCTWEGGDSHTVIRIVDGEVHEHKARFVAGDFKRKL